MDASQLDLARELAGLLERGERAALATVTRTSGSTPQVVGARLLLRSDGSAVGTIGGGRIEQVVLQALERLLATGETQTRSWDLGKDLGMCCGGRMEFLLEVVDGAPRAIVLGAGHVAQATVPLLERVGFRVVVVDEREELLSAERFPTAKLLLEAPDEMLAKLAVTDRDWILIVTQDHRLDERALEQALRLPHRYIGMIGSRRKVLRVLDRLQARLGRLDTSRLYAPVGLDIGGVTPAEIAVSIAAEFVALHRGKAAAHLSLGRARAQDTVKAS